MPDQHPDENGRGAAATQAATPPAAPVHSGRSLRGTAVEVWRQKTPKKNPYNGRTHVYGTCESLGFNTPVEPGVWRSQAEDALLLGVVEAVRRGRSTLGHTNSGQDCLNALAALDAWRPSDG